MSDAAFSNFTPEKMDALATLILREMTPREFRAALDKAPDFYAVASLYDSLLKVKLRRKNPLKAEAETMDHIRRWWVNRLSAPDQSELKSRYYGNGAVFFINLTRNWPYGNNPPHMVLRNGVPIWDLENQLMKMVDEACSKEIMKQIREQGGAGYYYQVRIAPSNPARTSFSVGVRRYTLDQLKAELERQAAAQKQLKAEARSGVHA